MKSEITIPGKPMGKQRPRMTRSGIAYTPKETVSYENLVKYEYTQQGGKYFEGNVAVTIVASFEVPKSVSKKKREQMLEPGGIRPTKKPDLDNIAKIICDSLNGIAYHDDSQVVDLTVRKYYAEKPEVYVRIEDL